VGVKNPWVRGDLTRHLGTVANSWRDPNDLEIDIELVDEDDSDWVDSERGSFPTRISLAEDPLVLAVRFLFETSPFTVDPESTLGVILGNLEELGAVIDVIESMHRAFKAHGMNLDDAALRGSKQWKAACRNAQYAFNLLATVDD